MRYAGLWGMVMVCSLAAGIAAIACAQEVQAPVHSEATGAEVQAEPAPVTEPVRLVKPWERLQTLSPEQREQIHQIHQQALAEIKQIRQREQEAILAVLTDAQRAELEALKKQDAEEKKAQKKPKKTKRARKAKAKNAPTTAPVSQ